MNPVAELHNGARMTQERFHRLYEQTPENFHAELIGGIVYVAAPLRLEHGINHPPLTTLFYTYEGNTPGVQTADNTTVLLGDKSEPQPDLLLRILPNYSGSSRNSADGYVKGAPELVAEVSVSTVSFDLHAKRDDYRSNGVLEYLVVNVRDSKVFWFDLTSGAELFADADGVIRLRTFPGLWIHVDALLTRNFQLLMDTLHRGLASPEHGEFVRYLQTRRLAD